MNKTVKLTLCSFLILTGCNSIRSTLGIERNPPDEFAVTPSSIPLDMPPDFTVLPKPRPGAPRPQDVSASVKAQKELLGSPLKDTDASSGQVLLLEMAGANGVSDAIRVEVDQDVKLENMDKSMVESIGFKKQKPKGKIINPVEEAKKLAEKGIATPQRPVVGPGAQ